MTTRPQDYCPICYVNLAVDNFTLEHHYWWHKLEQLKEETK